MYSIIFSEVIKSLNVPALFSLKSAYNVIINK